jgi:hypothetical protein
MPAKEWQERIRKAAPAWKARIAGAVYFISGWAYTFADGSVRGKLVVEGDGAATAHNILTHLPLYRVGFATDLLAAVLYIAVTLLLYDLFRPVNPSVSLAAAFFSFGGCILQAAGSLFHLAPLVILGGAPYLSVFKPEQLQSLALLSLDLRAQTINIYMVFFGCYCILIGVLILGSKFMPRIIGVFMAIAGTGYLTFLSPPLAHNLFPHVLMPAGALGEGSLILWLLIFGVNSQRWREQASEAGERRFA